jgi:hypothetical protein
MRGGQSLGFPTGLVVGGLVTDAAGYDAAFALAGGMGLFAALVAAAVLPDGSPEVTAESRLRDRPAVVGSDRRIAVARPLAGSRVGGTVSRSAVPIRSSAATHIRCPWPIAAIWLLAAIRWRLPASRRPDWMAATYSAINGSAFRKEAASCTTKKLDDWTATTSAA